MIYPDIIAGRTLREIAEDLLGRCQPIPFCGCWVWIGAWSGNSYGRVSLGGKMYSPHIITYRGLIGAYDPALHLDHVVCQTRPCIWPWHLEPVTPKINTERGNAVLFQKDRP